MEDLDFHFLRYERVIQVVGVKELANLVCNFLLPDSTMLKKCCTVKSDSSNPCSLDIQHSYQLVEQLGQRLGSDTIYQASGIWHAHWTPTTSTLTVHWNDAGFYERYTLNCVIRDTMPHVKNIDHFERRAFGENDFLSDDCDRLPQELVEAMDHISRYCAVRQDGTYKNLEHLRKLLCFSK